MKIVKKALITLVFGLAAASAHAQGGHEAMCEFFMDVAKTATELRDQGKTEREVRAFNDGFTAERAQRPNRKPEADAAIAQIMRQTTHAIFTDVQYADATPAHMGALVYADCMTKAQGMTNR